MKKCQYLNMKLVVFLSALATVSTATLGFAQLPGSGQSNNTEKVGGASLYLQDTYNEARNAGHLLSVWRGSTNNQVWMSLDNGKAFTIGGTVTYVAPTVVAFGSDSFMVFHTGDGGNIWYTQVFGDGHSDGTWTDIPGQTTNLTVSAAQMGPSSNNLYLVYRGSGSDTRVFGTWYDGQNNTWSGAAVINGGLAINGPGVSMNNATNQLFVTAQGLDSQLWMTHQTLGASSWNNWSPMGIYTTGSPYSVACPNGNMVVSIEDYNTAEYAKFDGWGNRQTGWWPDYSETITSPSQVTASGNEVFSLATIRADGAGANAIVAGYWEPIYNCN
jgi:hypothetical protein